MAKPLLTNIATATIALAESEFGFTRDELVAAKSGCIADALKDLTKEKKDSLRKVLGSIQTTLGQAIDMVKKRRTGLQAQRKRLQDQVDQQAQPTKDMQDFHEGAKEALVRCSDAAAASQDAKAASDLVFSTGIELAYRLIVLDQLENDLATQEQEFNSAMSKMDEIGVAIT